MQPDEKEQDPVIGIFGTLTHAEAEDIRNNRLSFKFETVEQTIERPRLV